MREVSSYLRRILTPGDNPDEPDTGVTRELLSRAGFVKTGGTAKDAKSAKTTRWNRRGRGERGEKNGEIK